MRWRLCLAEFDFQVAYKKGKLNQQADALSRLRTLAETVTSDPDEIPTFTLDATENSDTQLSTSGYTCPHDYPCDNDYVYEDDILLLEDQQADELFATIPEPTRNDPTFQPITHEELVIGQQQDAFCSDIRRKLNGGWRYPSASTKTACYAENSNTIKS